jgi:hypothetical protein
MEREGWKEEDKLAAASVASEHREDPDLSGLIRLPPAGRGWAHPDFQFAADPQNSGTVAVNTYLRG